MAIKYLLIYISLTLFLGCSSQPKLKQFELAEQRTVHTDEEYSSTLYETVVDTKGYKTLRLFVHIYNDEYKKSPLSTNSRFSISAFYGIGRGSWGYFNQKFPYKSTSGWDGVVDIPIVGEKTRIGIYGTKMKNRVLEIDIAATLF